MEKRAVNGNLSEHVLLFICVLLCLFFLEFIQVRTYKNRKELIPNVWNNWSTRER
jgi:hypothetical protein